MNVRRLLVLSALLAPLLAASLVYFLPRRALSNRQRHFVLRVPVERVLSANEIRFEPVDALRSARVGKQGWLAIERDASSRTLSVRISGMCPVELKSQPSAAGATTIEVKPLIDLGGDRTQLGFDAAFEVQVKRGCAEAERGHVTWRQLEGPLLSASLTISDAGFRLRALTLAFDKLHVEPIPHGIVPISPRTQGRYVFEALWHGDGKGAEDVRRTLTVTSMPRATGMPSIAVSQQVMLGGQGWHVAKAVRGGAAQVVSNGALQMFAPDAPGRWLLEDQNARSLTVQALWHDKTPLDCGRADCHAAISQAALTTPMSHALDRHLTTGHNAGLVSCMFECHVTGEPALHDGGFLDVARALDWHGLEGATWQELPQALRRLGGVRCTSCHGPGAIPEPAARLDILRSDVCATCHDAPPRYVHVQQWRESRMSRSDESARTRSEVACARCHTTRGFLRSAVRERPAEIADADFHAGIACAACHAPHDAQRRNKLVRAIAAPASLGDAGIDPRSLICLRCHAPGADEVQPSAASAALWLGQVKMPVSVATNTAETLRGSAPHAAVAGGCIGCHGSSGVAGGATDHSFRVDRSTCKACHGDAPREEQREAGNSVREHALQLARKLAASCGLTLTRNEPPHAAAPGACNSQSLSRALYEVLLVLEDPAAGVHNAPFARALLADAEARLKD